MKILSALVTLALLCLCSSAMAQWEWLDKDGRKVYSDRSPPPEVADKSIVKRPPARTQALAAKEAGRKDGTGNPAAEAAPASSASLPGGVDKDLEAKKKQAADAEAAKKKADEDRLAKARVENCAQAKQAMANLDSGVRVSRTNASGEREILDDASRATERTRIQNIQASECR